MLKEKIAIVNVNSYGRDFPEYIQYLESEIGPVQKFSFDQDVSSEELANQLRGYQYIILGTHPTLKAKFFDLDPNVKLVARHGLGYNNIDLEAARKHGVYVTKEAKITEQDAVAEITIALLHAVARNICVANRMVHEQEWGVHRERLMGVQLRNKVTGIIGYGNIGQRVGDIMKQGYNNQILVFDPFLQKKVAQEKNVTLCDLKYVLEHADIISLHCNLTNENEHLIGKEELGWMKPSAILLNCARGALVDEAAVAQAIENKELYGYGADACIREPIEPTNPLLKLDRVVLSPHVGVYNLECTKGMNQKVYEDILNVHNGKRPSEIVNGL